MHNKATTCFASFIYKENKINKTKQIMRKNYQKGLLFLVLSCIAAVSAFAQQINASGQITDSRTGGVLPGVNIIVKGTTLGTIFRCKW